VGCRKYYGESVGFGRGNRVGTGVYNNNVLDNL